MQELIRRCGVPLALYSDRHAVFKYVPGSHQSPAPTQFGRAMAELGVEQIFARSPEAKGRVERANGTFQDRLVTELRLAGARTISEANQVLWAFLTRFNKRFGVPPAVHQPYRSPDPDLNLAGILCFKHSRKVARASTTGIPSNCFLRANGPLRWSARGGPGAIGRQASSVLSKPNRPYPGSATASWCPPDSERHSRSWQRHRGEPRCRHGHQRDRWSRARKTGSDDRDRPGTRRREIAAESEAVHPKAQPPRPPTPRQRPAVQRAKRRGLSLRAIARELGSRITVRKYVLQVHCLPGSSLPCTAFGP